MIRALLAVSALAVADVLNGASERLAELVGGRSGDRVVVHLAPWRIVPGGNKQRLWDLHLASLPEPYHHATRPRVVIVHAPARVGRVVIVREFAPDGGGETYILDARDETWYDPEGDQ